MFETIIAEPLFFISFAIALLATGAIAGLLAGLLGVGGGIVIVPVLYLMLPLLGVDESVLMHVAVGTSLATIIPTSIMSARSHHKRGGVDFELLKSWGPIIFLGVVIGGYFGTTVKGEVLTLIFAVVAILVAANMALRKEGIVLADALPVGAIRHSLALVVGMFSVVMGIGGGTLSVPILTAFNYPIRRAVGTASAIGLIIALPGSATFILSGMGHPDLPPGSLGYANLFGFALIVPATMLMAPVGAKLAHSINPIHLRMAFAFFLLLTSLRMFYSILFG
ncbi:MAG: sulfite exporter TauE/SafE family protein [Pseudomonadales bacterium]|nr:sulfite exporter TauE/SafE family protein [Pseudomonadales bacterium]NRA18353.1 sulfite exporter TauE/SafE family protein [Oceanospirillaceae bacterium]